MDQIALKIENLGKRYRLGEARPLSNSLREDLVGWARGMFRPGEKPDVSTEDSSGYFWALRDINIEIKQGEVVGLIGRNGAGKSTLLKILSRITPPTKGWIGCRGRVASLLEVGTGFHRELTGRENIFLNGSILGMTRKEITRKFDEILAFAEVERFIDTPVKFYSSGMYVRLAFAVAAHLDPEILLVDEVLAVGDAEFQKKCLGKMSEVSKGGRTILFVSHNMVAVSQLCGKGIWLDRGAVKTIGPVDDVIKQYSASFTSTQEGGFAESVVDGDGRVTPISYRVTNERGDTNTLPVTQEDVRIFVRLKIKEAIQQPAVGITVTNEQGTIMTSLNTVGLGQSLGPLPEGEAEVEIRLGKIPYIPGMYRANFWVMNPQGHIFMRTDESIIFEVGQSPIYGTFQVDYRWGCVYTDVGVTTRSLGPSPAST